MEQKYCDLHIHTTYSDGERDVENLLEYAQQKKLKKLSITDHDCVDAYFEIKQKNSRNLLLESGDFFSFHLISFRV